MTNAPAPAQQPTNHDAFAFVQELAAELNRGTVELPGFPDIALRVRRVLSDEDVGVEQVVRVVGSEPVLATQLIRMANSVALNPSHKPVTELRAAVSRVGFNLVRSASIAFAMAQFKKVQALKGLEKPLEELWQRSAAVACMSYVVAKRHASLNPDTAFLAGLLHGIGRLYILTRAATHPALIADQASYLAIVRDWSSAIAKALLENWGIPAEIVEAVSEFEDHSRQHDGPGDLTDVLTIGSGLAIFKEWPETAALNLQETTAYALLQLDHDACLRLIEEFNSELEDLRRALEM